VRVVEVPAWRPPAVEGPVERAARCLSAAIRVERRLTSTTVHTHEDIARRSLSEVPKIPGT
jgi:hypothetical protein